MILTTEDGADVNEVYTFAWFHSAVLSLFVVKSRHDLLIFRSPLQPRSTAIAYSNG